MKEERPELRMGEPQGASETLFEKILEVVAFVSAITIFVIVVLALASCTTTKYVPVTTTKTDTLYKAKKDSVRFISLYNVKDSVRMHDSTVIFYDSKGGITKQEIWHWRERYRTEKDSTNYFKNVIDSLLSKKQTVIEKPIPVTKTVVEKYPFAKKVRIAVIFFVAGLVIGIFRKQILSLIIKLINK